MQVVIVGAGISGLAAAWELQRQDIAPVILERSLRAGGVIVTERANGFVIDGGPDALLVQKPAAVDLCRELGIADRFVSTLPPRTAFVMRRRRLIPLPEASFLGFPTRLGPLARSRLFSWRGKLRMAAEVFVSRGHDGDESIGRFITRRFGREVCDYLAEPLLAGIHAGDVDHLSVRALFPRLVDMEQQYGSVLRALAATPVIAGPRGAFVSFPRGMTEIVEALVSRLQPGTIRTGCEVVAIDGQGPFTVTLGSGESIEARAVILAIPAWAAAPLVKRIDPALAALCAAVQYASSATIVFGLARRQVRHPLNGTGFVVPRRERRTLMAATWVSAKWPQRAPEDQVLLRAFVGGTFDEGTLEQSDSELARAAFSELGEVLQIDGDAALTRVFRWPRATPQYHVGHLDRVRRIDERLQPIPGLGLTGSGYRGTGIPDCVADGRSAGGKAAALLR